MSSLTPKQAYTAMFEFLRRYYDRGKSDEIGALLGGLSLLDDGSSADSAHWSDWEESIRVVIVKDGYSKANLQLE